MWSIFSITCEMTDEHAYHSHVCLLLWAICKVRKKCKHCCHTAQTVDKFVFLRSIIKWHRKIQGAFSLSIPPSSLQQKANEIWNVQGYTNISKCMFYISLSYMLILVAVLEILFSEVKVYINICNSPFSSNYDLVYQKEQTKPKKTTITTTTTTSKPPRWITCHDFSVFVDLFCDVSFWKSSLKSVYYTVIFTDWEISKNFIFFDLTFWL